MIVLLLLLGLPGRLCELLLPDARSRPLLIRLTLWLGLSPAVIALIYLWLANLGFALHDRLLGTLVVGVLILNAASLFRIRRRQSILPPRRTLLWWGVGLGVMGLTFWTRYEQAAGLVLPVWVDSVHHTLLVRLIAERGVPPFDLNPFLPIDQLIYHWGYHAFLATQIRLTNDTALFAVPQLLLWSGQLLGGLQALVWGGAAYYFWRRPAAAVAAALVVGLVSIMPAYYLSWGRYTLLTGMLMLPAALVLADLALGRARRALPLVALLLAGLSLVHFVVLLFALAWCGVLAVLRGRRAVADLALLAGLTLVLVFPWFTLLLTQVRPGSGSAAQHVVGNPFYNQLPQALLWAGHNRLLLALAGGGALLALRARSHAAMVATLLIWCLAIVMLANPTLLGLPYLSLITNEFVTITMFAPIALLIAAGVGVLDTQIGRRSRYAAMLGVLLLALACAAGFRSVVRADTIIATAADRDAIVWAAGAIPPDARVAVNTAGWLNDVDRGADGGWWLLPLTGRQVSTPPVIYNYGVPEYTAAVKRETSELRNLAGDPAAAADFMRRYGYTYAYATDAGPAFKRAAMAGSALFEERYRNTAISIFRLVQ